MTRRVQQTTWHRARKQEQGVANHLHCSLKHRPENFACACGVTAENRLWNQVVPMAITRTCMAEPRNPHLVAILLAPINSVAVSPVAPLVVSCNRDQAAPFADAFLQHTPVTAAFEVLGSSCLCTHTSNMHRTRDSAARASRWTRLYHPNMPDLAIPVCDIPIRNQCQLGVGWA